MNYIEMGFTKVETEFLNEYPKLYPVASTLGISKQQIDYIFNLIDNNYMNMKYTQDQKIMYLRVILGRCLYLNVNFDLAKFKNSSEAEREKIFGKFSFIFGHDLLMYV